MSWHFASLHYLANNDVHLEVLHLSHVLDADHIISKTLLRLRNLINLRTFRRLAVRRPFVTRTCGFHILKRMRVLENMSYVPEKFTIVKSLYTKLQGVKKVGPMRCF